MHLTKILNFLYKTAEGIAEGLTLTKPLRQFHGLQHNIHRLLATTFVLVIEPEKYIFEIISLNTKF